MDSCIGSDPQVLKRLIDDVTEFFSIADGDSPSMEWGIRAERAVSTTYHGLLVTEMSIKGEGRDVLLDVVRRLLEIRVHVFVICTSQFDKAGFLQYANSLHILGGDIHPDEVREGIASTGVKFQNLLVVSSGDTDPFHKHAKALLRPRIAKPAISGDSKPTVFAATTDAQDGAIRDGFLPIVKEGTALSGPTAVAHLVKSLCFGRPLNLTEHARSISDKSLLEKLIQVDKNAAQNFLNASNLINQHQAKPHKEFKSSSIFDPRSGAVYFRPHEWRSAEKADDQAVKRLMPYFQERLPDYWQEDRPCYRRILFTPTKVLLRGEQYYVNMRNESPFARIEAMVRELQILEAHVRCLTPLHAAIKSDYGWKLVLAFLDQVRSIALQLFSFAHSAELLFKDDADVTHAMKGLYEEEQEGIHKILVDSIAAYYGWVMGFNSEANTSISNAMDTWRKIEKRYDDAIALARKANAGMRRPLGDLVRRWREADHPGENLMTAMIVAANTAEEPVANAFGIGWGGIELPLVYGYLSKKLFPKCDRHLHIAKYSHYRDPTGSIQWSSLMGATQGSFLLDGGLAVLFDDNTLTGLTLERVRDSLLLRGASRVRIAVTRYSGERRYAQMQMPGHGAVDPDALIEDVLGYIGETPFARSWSSRTKEYKSPIGVFSLSRRRILECIHNNSTVQLYDREGF